MDWYLVVWGCAHKSSVYCWSLPMFIIPLPFISDVCPCFLFSTCRFWILFKFIILCQLFLNPVHWLLHCHILLNVYPCLLFFCLLLLNVVHVYYSISVLSDCSSLLLYILSLVFTSQGKFFFHKTCQVGCLHCSLYSFCHPSTLSGIFGRLWTFSMHWCMGDFLYLQVVNGNWLCKLVSAIVSRICSVPANL